MSAFSIGKNRNSKITGAVGAAAPVSAARRVRAIVKVIRPNYVPERVEVRSRIDANMFTAEFPPDVIEALEEDEDVESITLSRQMQIID